MHWPGRFREAGYRVLPVVEAVIMIMSGKIADFKPHDVNMRE
jgi:hypothetical protein